MNIIVLHKGMDMNFTIDSPEETFRLFSEYFWLTFRTFDLRRMYKLIGFVFFVSLALNLKHSAGLPHPEFNPMVVSGLASLGFAGLYLGIIFLQRKRMWSKVTLVNPTGVFYSAKELVVSRAGVVGIERVGKQFVVLRLREKLGIWSWREQIDLPFENSQKRESAFVAVSKILFHEEPKQS